MSSRTYRPDIDGLRAIAVAAVLLFHVHSLSGGFVGVDVFFVISGYLITGAIWSEATTSSFSFGRFYARRVRRLFPALLVTVGVVVLLGYLLLLPSELSTEVRSAASALFYFSNLEFFGRSDYFSDALEFDPLLHTWSLALEEQFYFVYPAALVALVTLARPYEASRRVVVALGLGGLTLLSFATSVWLVSIDQSAAFFLLPTRFWQFALGGALALSPRRSGRIVSELSAWVGLLGLAWVFAHYDRATVFPGLSALAPTLFSVLVIHGAAHRRGTARWVLSMAPARIIGRASYSIYLVHWPLIVFYRLGVNVAPGKLEKLALLLSSVALGLISWRLVEMPTRHAPIETPRQRRRVLSLGILGSVGVGAAAAALAFFAPTSPMLDEANLQAFERYVGDAPEEAYRTGRCHLADPRARPDDLAPECLPAARGGARVLLLGDSFAAHLPPGIEANFSLELAQVTASGCRIELPTQGTSTCVELLRRAVDELVPSEDFDAVVLAGRWRAGDEVRVRPLVEALAAHSEVYVVGPPPEHSLALARTLARFGPGEAVADLHDPLRLRELDRRLAGSVVGVSGAHYVSAFEVLCSSGECEALTPAGVPMQFDKAHYTLDGSRYVVERLRGAGLLRGVSTVRERQ